MEVKAPSPARPPAADLGQGASRRRGDLARFLEAADELPVTEIDLDDALRWAIDLVCEYAGWPLGHVFRPGPDPDVLVSAGIWHDELPDAHEEFVAATRRLHLRAGEGIPGEVLAR